MSFLSLRGVLDGRRRPYLTALKVEQAPSSPRPASSMSDSSSRSTPSGLSAGQARRPIAASSSTANSSSPGHRRARRPSTQPSARPSAPGTSVLSAATIPSPTSWRTSVGTCWPRAAISAGPSARATAPRSSWSSGCRTRMIFAHLARRAPPSPGPDLAPDPGDCAGRSRVLQRGLSCPAWRGRCGSSPTTWPRWRWTAEPTGFHLVSVTQATRRPRSYGRGGDVCRMRSDGDLLIGADFATVVGGVKLERPERSEDERA